MSTIDSHWQRTDARNVNSRTFLQWPSYIINSVDKTSERRTIILSWRGSTSKSYQSRNLFHLGFLSLMVIFGFPLSPLIKSDRISGTPTVWNYLNTVIAVVYLLQNRDSKAGTNISDLFYQRFSSRTCHFLMVVFQVKIDNAGDLCFCINQLRCWRFVVDWNWGPLGRFFFSENVIRSYTLDNETSAGRQARKVNDSNLSLGDLFTLLRFSKSFNTVGLLVFKAWLWGSKGGQLLNSFDDTGNKRYSR